MEDPHFIRGFNTYIDNVRNNCYIFNVGKCCGYSEIVPIFKNANCSDLYRNVVCQFDIKPEIIVKLYTKDETGNILLIQNDNKLLRDLILENRNFFTPIYPIPTNVVYKLIYNCEKPDEKGGCENFCCSCYSNS